ncbi:MAG: hypothetical protein ACO1OB_30240 [Archangium sp.]
MACLTDNQLGALVEGALPDGAPEWAHLADCAVCAQLVSSLAEHAFTPPPRTGLVPMSLDGRRWAERFGVIRELGRGKRGITFEAVDSFDGARVALKVLWQRGEGAWAEAATTLLTWRHPFACAVRAFGVADDQPWLAYEFIPGARTLREVQGVALDGVSAALEAAHAVGITHGAISAGSVLIREDGTAVLSDFGLAYAPQPSTGGLIISSVTALPSVGSRQADMLSLKRVR